MCSWNKLKDKQKTEIILQGLTQYYTTWGKERTNIIFPELRLGSGYCGVSQRRIDMFVISSNSGNETTAYEIKVSRQDFKHDIDNDLKQRGARLYSNYFYYVTPPGLLKPEEIPLWAGLRELNFDKWMKHKDANFSTIVPAPLHAKAQPSWGLICSMIRHVNKTIFRDQLQQEQQKTKTLENELQRTNKLIQQIADPNFDLSLLPIVLGRFM